MNWFKGQNIVLLAYFTEQGSIFWPKFLIFSPSWKRGKLISSLFVAAFLRRNSSSDRFFRKKKTACELSKYRNLTEKGFFIKARSAKFFQILPFKLLKIHEKGKKLLNNCKKYYQGRAYFFPVSLFFSKSLFLPPPPGGGRCRPKYLPLIIRTHYKTKMGVMGPSSAEIFCA